MRVDVALARESRWLQRAATGHVRNAKGSDTLAGMLLTIGSQLGRYTIVAPLGAGGTGEVYRARDDRLGRDDTKKLTGDGVFRNYSLTTTDN